MMTPPPRRSQRWERVAGAQIDALHVHLEQPIEELLGQLADRDAGRRDTGVAQDDVQSAELLDDGADGGDDIRADGDVRAKKARLATLARDVVHDGGAFLVVDVDRQHARALLAEAPRDRGAESGGPAGDECHLALELHSHFLLLDTFSGPPF